MQQSPSDLPKKKKGAIRTIHQSFNHVNLQLVAARPHNSLIWFAVNGVNYVNDAVKNRFLHGSVHKQLTLGVRVGGWGVVLLHILMLLVSRRAK